MKRRSKEKIFSIIMFLTTMTIVSFIGINIYTLSKSSKSVDDNTILDSLNQKDEIIWPQTTSFNMLTTGDALLHFPVYTQYKTNDGFDFSNVFTLIKDYVNNYDVKYINQETVFASGSYSGYPLFNTPSAWGDAMIENGFNLFSLATNHSYDQYSSGAIEHINYWHSKDNIGYAGMNLSYEDDNFYINEVNGITYGFLSYTEHTNGLTVPSDQSYLVDIYNFDKASSDIQKLTDLVDIIIVAMHWGDEYTSEPNDNQIKMANELASLGVGIIIGSHPHWTQPIDYIDDTLVIYSLGNFLSNQLTLTSSAYYTESVAVGALVSYDVIMDTYEDGSNKVYTSNIEVELIYNYRASNGDYMIIPFSQMNSTYNKNYISIYEEHKDRFTMYNNLVSVNQAG